MQIEDILVDQQPDVDFEPLKLRRNPLQKRGQPCKEPADFAINFKHFLQLEDRQFAKSHYTKILGLLEKGVFEIKTKPEVLGGSHIFNSRFVNEVKNKGTNKAFTKSRLVVQTYNNNKKRLVFTQLLTIQRISQQIILCIATIVQETTRLYL